MTLKKICRALFFAGLFFFPFNEYEGIPALGEFRNEAGALFFFAGFVMVLIASLYTKKLPVPFGSPIFRVIFLFLGWCIISSLINLPTISENFFKQTTGINRFVRQYVSLLISTVIFFIFYWNVIVKMSIPEILHSIRKVLLISLIVASIYGFLEIMVSYFQVFVLLPVLQLFDYFPFLEVFLHPNGRISSISYEPPSFAIYLITIAGWMFSYVLTEKGLWKFMPTVAVLVLTFFSGSRTALLLVFFQLFIFSIILYRKNEFRKYIVYATAFILTITALLLVYNGQRIYYAIEEKVETLDFQSNLKNNVSNQSRFGMQLASLRVFRDNPVTGVGYGQQSYHSRFHYPRWAIKKNYEFEIWYLNKREPSFPPGYNLYTRLLAETGIIGLGLILYFIYLVIATTNKIIRNTTGDAQILAYILLISFAGLFVNWLQIDSFRIYGVWISLAILIKLSQTASFQND